MDSLLDLAAVDTKEPSALSRNSPKDSNIHISKDLPSPKVQSASLKDSCSGEKQMLEWMAYGAKEVFLSRIVVLIDNFISQVSS